MLSHKMSLRTKENHEILSPRALGSKPKPFNLKNSVSHSYLLHISFPAMYILFFRNSFSEICTVCDGWKLICCEYEANQSKGVTQL